MQRKNVNINQKYRYCINIFKPYRIRAILFKLYSVFAPKDLKVALNNNKQATFQ